MIGLLSCITSVITIDSGADMVHVAFHIGSPTSPAETIERVPPGSQSRTRAIGVTFLFSSAILRPFEDMTRRACANNAKSTPFNAQPSCSPVASDSINFPLINSPLLSIRLLPWLQISIRKRVSFSLVLGAKTWGAFIAHS